VGCAGIVRWTVGLGFGACVGVCVVRCRCWLSPAATLGPNASAEIIKPQTASIPVRLTLCSLNNR